jgi:low temperature requirement protein LtrA
LSASSGSQRWSCSASLAVPHAFGRDGLRFCVTYFLVRLLLVGCYAAVARTRDATLRVAVTRLA